MSKKENTQNKWKKMNKSNKKLATCSIVYIKISKMISSNVQYQKQVLRAGKTISGILYHH